MFHFISRRKNKELLSTNESGGSLDHEKDRGSTLQKTTLIFLTSIFILSAIVSILLPVATYAATVTSKTSLRNQVYTFSVYNAVIDCLGQDSQQSDNFGFALITQRTTEEHLRSGDWWRTEGNAYWGTTQGAESQASYISPSVHKENGNLLCNDVIKAAAPLFGYSDVFNFACAFIQNRANGSSCDTGNGDFKEFSGSKDNFRKIMSQKLWGKDSPQFTLDSTNKNAGLYILYRDAFLIGCSPKASASPPADYAYKDIRIIDEGGSDTTKTYEGIYRADQRVVYRPNDNAERLSCADIAVNVNKYAKDYKTYLRDNPTEVVDGPNKGCDDPQYKADNPVECSDAVVSTCTIEGIGWIICPVINFLAYIADASFGFLADNFLNTDTRLLNTSGPTYAAWSFMRTFANIAFVIVFLIIIFSQLTSIGITNYGVKKMMPRIVVAAILVNLSFIISQLAVDISNILGYSIKDLFNSISSTIVDTSTVSNAITNGNPLGDPATGGGFLGIAGTVLAGAVAGVAGYALISTLIPVILAAVVALLLILFILIARQAIVVLLIVVSPLAFVAFLLPNTENLFKQWRKMLTAMLVLFPIVALVYGASTLASTILSGAFDNSIEGDTTNIFGQIIASAILVLPLFAVPVLLKKSLEGIPVVGQMASKFASRANNNLGRKAGDSYKGSVIARGSAYRKAGTEAYRSKKFAERVGRGGLAGAMASGIAVTPSGRAGQKSLVKSATQASLKADIEEVEAAKAVFAQINLSSVDRMKLASEGSVEVTDAKTGRTQKYSGPVMQRAAIQDVMQKGSYGEQEKILSQSSSTGKLAEFAQTISSSAQANGLGGKDPALSGKRIEDLAQGRFDYPKAIGEAAREGKYTPEAFATMNEDARAKVIQVAVKLESEGDSSAMEAIRRAANGIANSPEIQAKAGTSQKTVDQLASLTDPPNF